MNDPAAVSTAGAWGLNIVASVGIIMVNKQIMSGYNFNYPTTLTALHFSFTAGVGILTAYLSNDKREVPKVPFWDLLAFSLVANGSVVAMNLSLMLNTVGFYQIAKLSVIPTVCLLEAIINAKTYSREVTGSVLIVMLGVAICTVTDFGVNLHGFLAALVALLCTSIQQIYIGSLQTKHRLGAFDLLAQTARMQATSLILFAPIVDRIITSYWVWDYPVTSWALLFISPLQLFIFLSCTFAVAVNLSQYLCIGKFSAVTYQVLGHMKTALVLFLGAILFASPVSAKNMGGIGIAVVGMVGYSWAVEKEKAAAKSASQLVSKDLELAKGEKRAGEGEDVEDRLLAPK